MTCFVGISAAAGWRLLQKIRPLGATPSLKKFPFFAKKTEKKSEEKFYEIFFPGPPVVGIFFFLARGLVQTATYIPGAY